MSRRSSISAYICSGATVPERHTRLGQKELGGCQSRSRTNLGHLGIGDARVKLCSVSELRYVIGLVRQALEKQMDNGDSDF